MKYYSIGRIRKSVIIVIERVKNGIPLLEPSFFWNGKISRNRTRLRQNIIKTRKSEIERESGNGKRHIFCFNGTRKERIQTFYKRDMSVSDFGTIKFVIAIWFWIEWGGLETSKVNFVVQWKDRRKRWERETKENEHVKIEIGLSRGFEFKVQHQLHFRYVKVHYYTSLKYFVREDETLELMHIF